MPNKGYVTVKDADLQCVWECEECGVEAIVSPDWYSNNGTPICVAHDQDMIYLRTEIRKDSIQSL